MKISNALHGLKTIAIDTAPFIYLVENHPIYISRMMAVVQEITNGRLIGVSSVITLTEVLIQPLKLNQTALVSQYERILLNSVGFRLVPIEPPIARRAADLRARYNLRTPDALQVATPLHTGCDAFLTNDKDLKRVAEITMLLLDELQA